MRGASGLRPETRRGPWAPGAAPFHAARRGGWWTGLESRLPELLALGSLLFYAPTTTGGFIWDDEQLIARPGWLESFSLTDPFFDNRWNVISGGFFYRPLLFLTFRLDLWMWGREAWAFHLSNVVDHALLVWMLAHLAIRLGMSTAGTAAGVGLFALHPSHVECVAWITGRNDVVASLLGAAALVVLLGPAPARWDAGPPAPGRDPAPGRRPWCLGTHQAARWLAASGLLLSALLCKESAVAIVLAAVALLRHRPVSGTPTGPAAWGEGPAVAPRSLAIVALPAVAVYWLLRQHSTGGMPGYPYPWPGSIGELAYVMAVDLRLLGRYLAVLLAGTDYGPMAYDEWAPLRGLLPAGYLEAAVREVDAELVLSGIALIGLGPWLAVRAWRSGVDAFALLLGVLSIPLTMNLTSAAAQHPFSDRFLFLTTMGGALMIGRAASSWGATPARSRPLWPLAIVVAALVVWVPRAAMRFERHRDMRHLCEEAVRRNPSSPLAHQGLGIALYLAGELEGADRELGLYWRGRQSGGPLATWIRVKLARGRVEEALDLAYTYASMLDHAPTVRALARAAGLAGRCDRAAAIARSLPGGGPELARARAELTACGAPARRR